MIDRFTMKLTAAVLLAVPAAAYAWGPQGHEVIGAVADSRLNAKARARVASILRIPLREAAKWADCVKDVKPVDGRPTYQPDPRYHLACTVFETPPGIAEMEDYVRRNLDNCRRGPKEDACHKQYHYTDVDIARGAYNSGDVGTSDHDLVASINAALVVLKGKPARAPFKIKDAREAVLLLAHLVGDLHQPLHVGAVYLDDKGQLVHPDASPPLDPKTETRGGNSLEDGETNMHAEWDRIDSGIGAASLPPAIERLAAAQPSTPGDPSTWAAAWASDTLAVASEAFAGVTFTTAGAKAGHWTARIGDRAAYDKRKSELQERQLAKAGRHLADLLNSVWH